MKLKRITKTAIAAALLTAVLMSGCGKSDEASGSGSNSGTTVDTAAIAADAMLEALKSPVEMALAEKAAVDNYYGLDTETLVSCHIYMNSSFEAQEIAVVTPKADNKDATKKLLEKRLEKMKEDFIDYKPEVYKTIDENAKILENGDVLCLISGDAAGVAAAEKAFNDALK